MAEIYFPDGTKLSDLAGNTGNLATTGNLTLNNWATNPAPTSDMVRELDTTDFATTQGSITNGQWADIIINLGASKRVIASMMYSAGAASSCMIRSSDDGSTYYTQAMIEGLPAGGDPHISCSVKAQYIKFRIYNTEPTYSMSVYIAAVRIYKL